VVRVELRSMRHRLDPVGPATFAVSDDGSHRVTGDRRLVDLTESVLRFPGLREVSLADHARAGARAMPRSFGNPSPYAVVVEDSAWGA
jgi:hypothetical protein